MKAENNNPRRVASCGGLAVHFNGTATTEASEVDIISNAKKEISTSLLIQNRDITSTNDLLISLDGGSDFFTIEYEKPLQLNVSVDSVTIKSSAGSVDYEIIATY
jgi:hypothetical protein